MAQTIPRADAYPDFPPTEGESTTITPTTTGTVGGEFYRLASPSRMNLDQPVSEQDVRNATDAALLFGLPTMKMSDVEGEALNAALRKLGKEQAAEAHEGLRYAVRAANRAPDEGPQHMPERADLVRAAAGLPSKFRQQLKTWLQGPGADVMREHGLGLGPEGAEPGPGSWRAAYRGEHKVLDPTMTRVTDELGITGKGRYLKNFATRRELEKLGWKAKDLEQVPESRIADILNRNIENVGQGPKWAVIDAGQAAEHAAEMARRRAANAEGVRLTSQSRWLNRLRDQAVDETLHHPLEPVQEGESYPLVDPEWEKK